MEPICSLCTAKSLNHAPPHHIHLGACKVISLTFFLSPVYFLVSLIFLKPVFPEASPSWLTGSAVPHGGVLRRWLKPPTTSIGQTLASPYRGHSCSPTPLPTASTWSPALNSTCQVFHNFELQKQMETSGNILLLQGK